MKVKLDENLPASLVGDLSALGHDADSVPQEKIQGRPDDEVFAAAQREGRFLVTQDLDFSDVRKFAPGTHHGLLLVRLHGPGRIALRRRVRAIFETEEVASWDRCFVVVTDRKLRVRRPSK
jgi:predicted nuclease of predicted toxin-antitoxin system